MILRSLIYNTCLTALGVGLAPIWGGVLLGRPKQRAGFRQKATGTVPERAAGAARPIWYHAVSVGEVIASQPLLQALSEVCHHRPIWVSTVTATGQATARSRISFAAGTFFFPYDLPWVVDRVIRRLQPAFFLTAETELWPNSLMRLSRYGVPSVLVNGRISDRSFRRYKRARRFLAPVLRSVACYCMQSAEAAARICAIGAPADRVLVAGNLKFDQPLPNGVDQAAWRTQLAVGQERIWVAGSTHPGEEALLLRVFRSLKADFHDLRLLLAPRAPERLNEVEQLVLQSGLRVVRRSKASRFTERPEVVLLDTVGELSQLYAIAHVGFVGGSLISHGGHNPLEVAAHRRPVVFGPHMENFREISSILETQGGASRVRNASELEQCLRRFLSRPEEAQRMGQRAYEALLAHRGATDRILAVIRPLLRS
jgi:3-deoxy-D-manno-octulosonic-acid transferase